MNRDGAVERSAATFFPAANISALSRVTRACVVPVKSRSTPVAIAGKSKPKCSAVPKKMKWKAKLSMLMEPRKNGQGFSAVMMYAIGPLTVAYTHARRPATLKTCFLHIALDRPTLLSDVHVAKPS
ncbi:uncharacterized protein N7484_001889 [Penicillium longicatenatum]|uniref:uncharacterized protein n=1 Tax=Penicillium longicatenatum TaxID=1561947 RepID=UPI002548EE8D|nr:uncharacterized protein N7484_001889 [Penicillium longicatenatum]KAJ5658240.1 hypothetical protein N7484_001889 [Penicillium longicatenatum]